MTRTGEERSNLLRYLLTFWQLHIDDLSTEGGCCEEVDDACDRNTSAPDEWYENELSYKREQLVEVFYGRRAFDGKRCEPITCGNRTLNTTHNEGNNDCKESAEYCRARTGSFAGAPITSNTNEPQLPAVVGPDQTLSVGRYERNLPGNPGVYSDRSGVCDVSGTSDSIGGRDRIDELITSVRQPHCVVPSRCGENI